MKGKLLVMWGMIGVLTGACFFYEYQPGLPGSPIPATSTPEPTIIIQETEVKRMDTDIPHSGTAPLVITIVYDNCAYDQRLKTDWGYSALVEYGEHTLLFDTGTNGAVLLDNMRLLGIDPDPIEAVVLSHAHNDHVGGLTALLDTGIQPPVYMLPSFSGSFRQQVAAYSRRIEVTPGQEILPGIHTTGEIQKNIPEQSLVIRTELGLVVITGCAHPGIVLILEQAAALFEEPIYLVMGGFHLRDKNPAQIRAILEDFRRLGIENVAPSHCTGSQAISMFAEEYGEHYFQAGAGRIFHVGE